MQIDISFKYIDFVGVHLNKLYCTVFIINKVGMLCRVEIKRFKIFLRNTKC